MIRRLFLVAAPLLLAAGPAPADTFVMRDGDAFEAQVLREFKDAKGRVDRWEVRTLQGRRMVFRSEVRTLRPAPPDRPPYPWEDFESRFAFTPPEEVETTYALGLWAREKGMEAEARRAFERILEVDPDHARARTALGHIKVEGRWIVPAGLRRGPEDRGSPVVSPEPSPLEGALGRVLAKRESENFRVESTHLDQRALGRYLDTLERTREATVAFLGEPPPVSERRPVYLLLRDAEEYGRALDLLVAPALEEREDRDAADRELRLFRRSHLAILPGPRPGCVAWPVDENEVVDRAYLAHFAVHELWRGGAAPRGRGPDWLREAVAYAVLNEMFPDDPTYCVETGYALKDRARETWRNTRNWAGIAHSLAVGNRAMNFADLAVLDLNSLSFDALVQAWSVLQVLREKDASGTRVFLRKVRQGADQFQVLRETLRLDPADVDRLWRQEMLKNR